MRLRHLGAAGSVGLLIAMSVLPSCTSTAGVSEVWMSPDPEGGRRRTTFYTDSENVVCLAEYGIGRDDVTMELLIRQTRDAVDDVRTVNVVVALYEFHPNRTNGVPEKVALNLVPLGVGGSPGDREGVAFAPGSYVCEVRVDGAMKASTSFTIAYPSCPASSIVPRSRCLGFFKPGTDCARAGTSGDAQPTCTCNDDGQWECPDE